MCLIIILRRFLVYIKRCAPVQIINIRLSYLNALKAYCPDIKTKSGLMVGLGEIEAEVLALLNDLKDYQVDLVTIGQYLQPSKSHAPIHRFLNLQEFERYTRHGKRLGFKNI